MDKIIKPSRLFVIILLIVALTAIFLVTLYRLQIVEGASYFAQSQDSVSTTVSVPAARGDIRRPVAIGVHLRAGGGLKQAAFNPAANIRLMMFNRFAVQKRAF